MDSKPYSDETWTDEEALSLVDFDGALVGSAWLDLQLEAIAREETRLEVLRVVTESFADLASDMTSILAEQPLLAFTRGVNASAHTREPDSDEE